MTKEPSLPPTHRIGVSVLLAATLAFSCRDPIRDGCKFATGMNAACKPSDGDWIDVRGEPFKSKFPVSPIMLAVDAEKPAAEDINSSLRALGAVESVKRNFSPAADVDAVEKLMLRRFLLMYPARGTINDCLLSGNRERALTIMLRKDASGYVFLDRGPISAMNSSVFESDYVSAKIRTEIEAKFSQQIKDPAKLTAAVDATFSLITKNVRSDFVAGHYRSLSLRSHQQLWEELVHAKVVRDDCTNHQALVSVGLSVATLASRETLADSAIGTNFDAALSAAVGGDAALAATLKASAKAVIKVAIETTSKERLQVSLDTPALVPLAWKPDSFLEVTNGGPEPKECRVTPAGTFIPVGAVGDLGQCTFRPGALVTVRLEGKVQLDGFPIDADTWIAYTFSAGDRTAPKFDHATPAKPIPEGAPGYSGQPGPRVITQVLTHVPVPEDGVLRAKLVNDFTHTKGAIKVVEATLTMFEEPVQ